MVKRYIALDIEIPDIISIDYIIEIACIPCDESYDTT